MKLKSIPAVKPYYASREGEIYKRVGRKYYRLSPQIHRGKYRVFLTVNGKRQQMKVDWLTITAYRGRRDRRLFEVFHTDGNCLNDKLNNLRWKRRRNKGLYDVLSEKEYALWKQKLDTLSSDEWQEYNNRLLTTYIRVIGKLRDDREKEEKFIKCLNESKKPTGHELPVGVTQKNTRKEK